MRKKACLLPALCFLFPVFGGLWAAEERTLSVDASSIWRMADYRAGLVEEGMVRPDSVLMLSSAQRAGGQPEAADLVLGFDQASPSLFADSAGRYRVSVSSSVASVPRSWARAGAGAVQFGGGTPGADIAPFSIEPSGPSAMFSSGSDIRDFTVEFWLYPFSMENGEEVFAWTASVPSGGGFTVQSIAAVALRGRLEWSFANFFSSPDRKAGMEIRFTGEKALVPRTWSHHLVRFDAQSGMLEYLVDAKPEAVSYATSSGGEGGEVYIPRAGNGGSFVLGGNYSGIMDEFSLYGSLVQEAAGQRYPAGGGRIETMAIDMGAGSNRVLRLSAEGGRILPAQAASGSFTKNGGLFFPDDSGMQFFVRASANPFSWGSAWHPVVPGRDIPDDVSGRYVQFAVDFYPSADGEASPYLGEVGIVFLRDEPPAAPAGLAAVALDGAVQLTWKQNPDLNVRGYMVYYGTSDGDFFGEDASLGPSPLVLGTENTVVIGGLKNGTLYFFRVAAYSHENTGPLPENSNLHAGEVSGVVRARPLPGAGLTAGPAANR